MPESQLARKLQIKPHSRVLLLDAPDGYLHELGEMPEGVEIAHRAKGHYDVAQVFAANQADALRRAQDALKALKPGGALWVCWPKQSAHIETDLNRDILFRTMQPLGLQAVSNIAINETWSALRFKRV
jgi:hypothetical protein